jgi:heat shock protein HslJ
MEMETAVLNALEMADNYSKEKDTITLNNAAMVSLAKFQLIYGE